MRIAIGELGTLMTAFKARFNSATINIYSGTRPATPATALSGNTLLATATFNATAFGTNGGSAPNVTVTANAITQDSAADAAGIPTFARIVHSDGTTLLAELSVGKTGGAEELLINTVDGSGNAYIAGGGPVSISSCTFTFSVGN